MGMSREEAKEQSLDITGYSDSYELIDEIYDDFDKEIHDNNNRAQKIINKNSKEFLNYIKNKTCGECKYFTFENEMIGTCQKGIYDKQLCSSEDYLVSTFGCNKWESK